MVKVITRRTNPKKKTVSRVVWMRDHCAGHVYIRLSVRYFLRENMASISAMFQYQHSRSLHEHDELTSLDVFCTSKLCAKLIWICDLGVLCTSHLISTHDVRLMNGDLLSYALRRRLLNSYSSSGLVSHIQYTCVRHDKASRTSLFPIDVTIGGR